MTENITFPSHYVRCQQKNETECQIVRTSKTLWTQWICDTHLRLRFDGLVGCETEKRSFRERDLISETTQIDVGRLLRQPDEKEMFVMRFCTADNIWRFAVTVLGFNIDEFNQLNLRFRKCFMILDWDAGLLPRWPGGRRTPVPSSAPCEQNYTHE